MDKDWGDMTPNEKADHLRREIGGIIRHMDNMFSQMNQRLSAMEAASKHTAGSPTGDS